MINEIFHGNSKMPVSYNPNHDAGNWNSKLSHINLKI